MISRTISGGTFALFCFAILMAARPLQLRAQKSPAVIGFLGGQTKPPPKGTQGDALVDGFRNNGLILGRDLIFETRLTDGDDERFAELARDLVRLKTRVILMASPTSVVGQLFSNPFDPGQLCRAV
jgi:putative ABC transport system substrate-binding protein